MSQLLERAVQQGDPQRVADLAANDAAELARDQADLDYLTGRDQRDARHLQETLELERGYHQRAGWLL